jgi:hypothetical protein
MDRNEIKSGMIFFAIGNSAVCIEPLLFWSDQQHKLHDRAAEVSDLERLNTFTRQPDVLKTIAGLYAGLIEIFKAHGCAQLQIGKIYPYLETREDNTARLVTALKAALDPENFINPGSLGLQPSMAIRIPPSVAT